MQPSKLYSLACFILALMAGESLAAPLTSFNEGDIQVLGRDLSTNGLEIRAATTELEARGAMMSKIKEKNEERKDAKPKPNTCPYCGTTYATADAAKHCNTRNDSKCCKRKF
ncbi:hypothetical protein C8J56DRAFT_1050235 [Mycena floridula]|nr:hypothetical protein C8J56DRAFT_1050235 [Mycena floridula]